MILMESVRDDVAGSEQLKVGAVGPKYVGNDAVLS